MKTLAMTVGVLILSFPLATRAEEPCRDPADAHTADADWNRRAHLLGVLGGDRSMHAKKWRAMAELVNLGDESIWPDIERELALAEWEGRRETLTAIFRAKLDYSMGGDDALVIALSDEREELARWAAERLRDGQRVGALDGARAFIAGVEQEGREIIIHGPGQASREWRDFVSRWASVYTRAVVVLRGLGGEDLIAEDRAFRRLLTKEFLTWPSEPQRAPEGDLVGGVSPKDSFDGR